MRLALVLLSTLVLAGCGSTAASLEDSAEATSAETSRFEMEYRLSGAPVKSNFAVQMSGVFDFPNERAGMEISGDMPFFGEEDISWTEFRLIGKTGYIRWVVKGTPYWVKGDASESSGRPTELLIPLPGTLTTPTDVLTRVLGASDDNAEIGREEIRGTDTTHYRARVDVKELQKQLRADDQDRHVEDVGGPRFIPVELWIDDESRLRRITILEKEEGDPVKLTMTVELFDYGVEVHVQPPSGEVILEEEFNKLTGDFVELTVGEGEADEVTGEGACESAREHLPKKEADRFCQELKEKE